MPLDIAAASTEIGGDLMSSLGGEAPEAGADAGDDHGAGGSGDLGAGDAGDSGTGDSAGDGGAGAAGGSGDAVAPKPGETAGSEGGEGAPAGSAAPGPDDAPRTWRPEAQAKWASLPPEVKAEIVKREDDMFRGIEQYKHAARFGTDMHAVVEQFAGEIQQAGGNIFDVTRSLLTANRVLAFGTTEQRVELLNQVCKDYGIDLAQLVNHPSNAYEAPEVTALRKDFQTLQSRLSAREAQDAAAAKEGLSRTLDAFIADTKAHPYFNEVGNDMATLMMADKRLTLQEAYDKAIWANPVTRAKEQQRINAEAEAKRAKEEAERVAKAKKAAGGNVRTSDKGGRAAAPLGSMDDTLNETLAEIRSRG